MYLQLALLLVMFLQNCQTADIPEKLLELGKSGDLKAQMSIASRYHSLKNYKQSGRWLMLAARQQHAPAMYELGNMYRKGLGVEPDEAKAKAWFSRAAKLGHKKAQGAMKETHLPGGGVLLEDDPTYSPPPTVRMQPDTQSSGVVLNDDGTPYVQKPLPVVDYAEEFWKLHLQHLKNNKLNEASKAAESAMQHSTNPVTSKAILESLTVLKFAGYQYSDCIRFGNQYLKEHLDPNILLIVARCHYLLGDFDGSYEKFKAYAGSEKVSFDASGLTAIIQFESSGNVMKLASPEFSTPLKIINRYYGGDSVIHFVMSPEAQIKFVERAKQVIPSNHYTAKSTTALLIDAYDHAYKEDNGQALFFILSNLIELEPANAEFKLLRAATFIKNPSGIPRPGNTNVQIKNDPQRVWKVTSDVADPVKDLKEYSVTNPEDSTVYYWLMRFYSMTGNLRLAIVNGNKYVEKNPSGDLGVTYYFLSTASMYNKDYDACIQYATLALEISEFAPLLMTRGTCHYYRDNIQTALIDFYRYAELEDKKILVNNDTMMIQAVDKNGKSDILASPNLNITRGPLDQYEGNRVYNFKLPGYQSQSQSDNKGEGYAQFIVLFFLVLWRALAALWAHRIISKGILMPVKILELKQVSYYLMVGYEANVQYQIGDKILESKCELTRSQYYAINNGELFSAYVLPTKSRYCATPEQRNRAILHAIIMTPIACLVFL
ncbi:MAG: sel1 repeat family protein [Candidatus Cloacimonetes bacterium]|nr:sel1 repeat family protein [Candidatus Cloacimonadota bacterium]